MLASIGPGYLYLYIEVSHWDETCPCRHFVLMGDRWISAQLNKGLSPPPHARLTPSSNCRTFTNLIPPSLDLQAYGTQPLKASAKKKKKKRNEWSLHRWQTAPLPCRWRPPKCWESFIWNKHTAGTIQKHWSALCWCVNSVITLKDRVTWDPRKVWSGGVKAELRIFEKPPPCSDTKTVHCVSASTLWRFVLHNALI